MANFFSKLKDGLKKTRNSWFDAIFGEDRISDEFFDELEESMILADMGVETSTSLVEALRGEIRERKLKDRQEAREALIELIAQRVAPEGPFPLDEQAGVILIVGVNGVGKTTSIGKISHEYKARGRKPMLAAADTFRAAAAEQLGIWAERAGVPMVRHQEGSDPAAVVYDAIASYKAKGCDLLIVDTAGRLHNKKNLMNELSKIRKVIDRELPGVPCQVLLVLDATTGQNALAQALAFQEASDLDGVILTKLDGTAKGGVVVNICNTLHVPVRFIGVGEGIDDLKPFDGLEFAQALL